MAGITFMQHFKVELIGSRFNDDNVGTTLHLLNDAPELTRKRLNSYILLNDRA